MHIAILSPSDKSFISKFLPNIDITNLPDGYFGAPFIGTIITELISLNHRVTAITTTKAQNGDYEVRKYGQGNFTWIVIPSRPHSIRWNDKKVGRILDFYALERKSMVNCITEIHPDIVHAHWSYEFAGAAVNSGFPNLVTVHDNAFQVLRYFKNIYRFGRLIMSEQILKKVQFASTVSPYMLAYAQRKCKTVKIIPNPTLISASISNIESLIKIKSESLLSPRILMINNGWDARKNGMSGLVAFQQLQKVIPEATLHLLGSGTEDNGLAYKDAGKLGLKNIIFHGPVAHQQLIMEIQAAHLLLHSSLEESFGVVLIEAMSFGLPAIGGVNSGAVPWVLNDSRLLVDVSNPGEIKDKLIEILTNEALYKEIAIKGYQNVVARFSVKEVVNQYLDYYRNIITVWPKNKF
jgi:glycosyltransferase involved in cell wall biosynthesis